LSSSCNIFKEIILELNRGPWNFQHKENTHQLNNEACTLSSSNIYGPTYLLHFPILINYQLRHNIPIAAEMQHDAWVILVQNKNTSLVYEILISHVGKYQDCSFHTCDMMQFSYMWYDAVWQLANILKSHPRTLQYQNTCVVLQSFATSLMD
jgi:hypothetical protein